MWADALQVLGRQAPQQAATLLHQFQSEEPPPSIQEAAEAAAQLQQHGFEPPAWDQLMNNPPVPPDPHPHEGPNIMKGWQQGAANACHTTFQAELHSCLDPASQALLESQRGPHASRPFTTIPYHADTTYESHLFRILLLRRLRLPIPLTASHCRCRRALDPYADHRAACAQFRDFTDPSRAFGTSYSQDVPGGRSPSHHQHTTDQPQHRTFHPSR